MGEASLAMPAKRPRRHGGAAAKPGRLKRIAHDQSSSDGRGIACDAGVKGRADMAARPLNPVD